MTAATKTSTSLSAMLALLLLSNSMAAQTRPHVPPANDRVTITRRKIILLRRGQLAKEFPERRKAVVIYPIVSGLRNQTVLQRVRALLQLKNIFGTTLADYRNDAWLEELTYEVNYNQNYLLDLTFTESGAAAYPDSNDKHLTIDLHTGRVLKATDVFMADKLESLASRVDEKLQQELKETTPEILKSGEISAQDLADLYAPLKFEVTNLDDFKVTKDGIVFLYDAGFPHVVQALEPDGQYLFSYAELKPFLKPDGPLWQFVAQ